MQQHFYAGFGTTQQPTFVAYVKDGNIYGPDASGQQVIVGVLSKVHDELKADYDSVFKTCQEYYDRLVELGEITPQLTGDALIKAQAEELAKATQLIAQMSQNQEQLLSVIKNMTHVGQTAGEAEHESVANHSESDAGDLATVETGDNGSKPATGPVQKHKGRFAQGHNRKKFAGE